ncbi:hypothetical protein [Amycolatopsis albispora]|uniref:hypothetical protein n=1 Tax=Amycolatopsis albispora TaxID=1804986 RepID=UPI0013B43E44|nr:hypothetical protein [Amycolatopsis albispora]
MSYREIDRGFSWIGRIFLNQEYDHTEIQATVSRLSSMSLDTITGYYDKQSLTFTMLRWPEHRPNYRPTPPDIACDATLNHLSDDLNITAKVRVFIGENRLHVLLGRLMNGYGTGKIAPLSLFRANVADYAIREVYMISARVHAKRGLESYGEPAVIIETRKNNEGIVHATAEQAQQHHYAIEFGEPCGQPGCVILYETDLARRVK